MGSCELLAAHARRVYGMASDSRTPAAARLARKLSDGTLGERFTLDLYGKEGSSIS